MNSELSFEIDAISGQDTPLRPKLGGKAYFCDGERNDLIRQGFEHGMPS